MMFGVDLSRRMAKMFNVSVPTVVSVRDVPGMPRASIPILKRAGVEGLSEGMNGLHDSCKCTPCLYLVIC